jgi:hypothetical protein
MPGTKADYDNRKRFVENLKTLSKSEHEEIFRILKMNCIEHSENSNGIFFDVLQIENDVFSQMEKCIIRSEEQKDLEAKRLSDLENLLKGSKASSQ